MLYVISGSSCGGKSTLINALASCGYDVADEPGRSVVRSELASGGSALPWKNSISFLTKCLELSVQKYDDAASSGKVVFFDRSLVDAASALIVEHPEQAEHYWQLINDYQYAPQVFMAPPWPELFENDEERKHTFEESVAEYKRLREAYSIAGYTLLILPKKSVTDRIEFVLDRIE